MSPAEFHDLMRALSLVGLDWETKKQLGAQVVNLLTTPPSVQKESKP
jgi:hypothetical protein